jgi:hypothetical protein
MTDALTPTREEPGPFDGMENAKPGEPVFTLQGGDPLAAALVQLWADAARVRAGIITADSLAIGFAKLAGVAAREPVGQHKRDEMKIRATEAEAIGWEMSAYRKGEKLVEKETESYSGHKESGESKEQAKRTRSLHDLAHNIEEAKYYVSETALGLDSLDRTHPAVASRLRDIAAELDGHARAIRPARRADAAKGGVFSNG